ncbi:hypothetical protein [Vibrio lentus]|uniref:calcium-binding protein n=1 Tax=Vibrio lentus TaxID=136468 RepID=UPI0039A42BFC
MYQLTPGQLTLLKKYYEEERYVDAYQVITDNVSSDYSAYKWFDFAAGINAGEGYASAYIRGYTVIAEALGDVISGEPLTIISSEQLQIASDKIAKSVLEGIILDNGILPDESYIYDVDAQKAKDYLGLNDTEWGGIVPAVIGVIDYEGELPEGAKNNTLMVIAAYYSAIYAGASGTLDAVSSLIHELSTMFDTDVDIFDDLSGDLFDEFISLFDTEANASELPVPAPPIPPTPRRDPLTLDLDGDGVVGTLDSNQGVFFDLDNSGFAEQTSWVAPNDGLLVLDKNNNDVIDGGAELFGTDTLLSNGQYAANGFEALADLDDNNDGQITEQDSTFGDLRVWQDRNSNGITDNGELNSLSDLNITSVGLNYTDNPSTDENNVEHREQGLFSYGDETSGLTNTLWFDTDRRNTVPVDVHHGVGIEVADDIAALPDAVGFGNVYSLHQAMSLDKTGELQGLVEEFVLETEVTARWVLVNDILAKWTGQDNIDTGGRGGQVNGQDLAILETFWGQAALQENPTGQYAQIVTDVYQGLTKSTYSQLMAGSHVDSLFEMLSFTKGDGLWVGDFCEVSEYFARRFSEGDISVGAELSDFVDVVSGLSPYNNSMQDSFVSELVNQAALLDSTARVAMLATLPAGYVVLGTEENDSLKNDGGETALFGGDGKDTLTSGGGNTSLYGGAGKDNLTGSYQGNNTLNGGEGDDVLQLSSVSSYYKDSDNHLRGGLGDDHITSGYGKDTYYYDLGDGHDVIKDTGFDASGDETKHRQDKLVLGSGIHRDMLSFTHDGDGNILINILDENDASNNGSITLKGAYINSLNHIELIEFSSDSSGSSNMDASAILAASVNMYGTEGDDYIKGTRLAESIHAGAGDDEIHANDGDDIIHAGAGDDEIHANDGDDIIHAGAGDDEIHADGGNDEIYAGIGNDTIYTGQGNDIAYGGDGKDTLTSGGGNTSLYGGAGKDNLTGSYQGNNTLNGGEGDDVLQLSSVSSYYKDSDNHLRGGLGDDHITSGYGKDTYYYDLGDGHDVIKDTGFDASEDETKHRQDKLVLGAGIHRDMLSFTHDGDGNILINILDENDASNNGSITLKGAYINSLNHIELIEFSSDSSGSSNMDASAILAASVNMYGTEGDDYIKGTRLAESIHAGAGDDEIHANDGDDIIHAGAGDDEIHADGGNDEIYAAHR